MISINTQVDGVPQNAPVSFPKPQPYSPYDCIEFCFQPENADVFETEGSAAVISIEFGSGVVAPPNGTEFTFWGQDLEIDDAQNFTSQKFKVVTGDGLQTGVNFMGMIAANFFLGQYITAEITAQTSDSVTFDLTWKTCGEQTKFSGVNMDLQPLEDLGGVIGLIQNGVSPVYKEGFQLVTRLNFHESVFENGQPITAFEALAVPKQCDTVGEVCINYADDIWQKLDNPIPESEVALSGTTRELMRLFSISYGWIFREDCQPQSGEIKQSDLFLAIAGYQPRDDETNFARYWANHDNGHPNGLNTVEFLTTQPKRYEICRTSKAWLWILNNWQSTDGTYNLRAKFVARRWVGGNVVSVATPQFIDMGNGVYDVAMWFTVSPERVANLFGFPVEELHSFDVRVEMWDFGLTAFEKVVSETVSYFLEGCVSCDDETDIYFVTPAGGIGTIPIQKISETVEQEGDSIVLPRGCSTNYAKRGQIAVNLKNVRKYECALQMDSTAETRRWLTHFMFSPKRWIRNQKLAFPSQGFVEKFYLDTNSIKVYQNGGSVEWSFTGYTGEVLSQKTYQ